MLTKAHVHNCQEWDHNINYEVLKQIAVNEIHKTSIIREILKIVKNGDLEREMTKVPRVW